MSVYMGIELGWIWRAPKATDSYFCGFNVYSIDYRKKSWVERPIGIWKITSFKGSPC